jgi:hypothetical protein
MRLMWLARSASYSPPWVGGGGGIHSALTCGARMDHTHAPCVCGRALQGIAGSPHGQSVLHPLVPVGRDAFPRQSSCQAFVNYLWQMLINFYTFSVAL